MKLKIDDDTHCGGYNVRLLFENQNKKCFTAFKGGFSAGDLLSWEGSELSDCETMIFDKSTTVKVESTSSNQFCPKSLKVISQDQTSIDSFLFAHISTGFYDASIHNNIAYQLKKRESTCSQNYASQNIGLTIFDATGPNII